MIIAILIFLVLAFALFMPVLYFSSSLDDRELEDQEQEKYLREWRERHQKK